VKDLYLHVKQILRIYEYKMKAAVHYFKQHPFENGTGGSGSFGTLVNTSIITRYSKGKGKVISVL
jgi:hypothetical protein